MALPRLLDHQFLALTAQLTERLAPAPLVAPGPHPPEHAQVLAAWNRALANGAEPTASIGLELPLSAPPNAVSHVPLCALEVMLACWSDEHLAWGLAQLDYPDLSQVAFPGLAQVMATNVAHVVPAAPVPAVVKALGAWRGRGTGPTAVHYAIRSPLDLWEAISHRLQRSRGPSHADEEFDQAQDLLHALERCGLSWQASFAPEAVCAAVAKSWETYPNVPLMPGFQRALLDMAPAQWWNQPVPTFSRLAPHGHTLLEHVAANFPVGPCRDTISRHLAARAARANAPQASTPASTPG